MAVTVSQAPPEFVIIAFRSVSYAFIRQTAALKLNCKDEEMYEITVNFMLARQS